MKKNEIEIGKAYRVKVGSNICDVRITGENRHGGWDCVNTATNRAVRIKSAQRLRGLAEPRPTRRKKIVSLAEYEAEAAAETVPTDEPAPTEATGAADGAPATKRGRKAKDVEGKPKKASGLDAAVQVLAEAGEPLSTGEMVKRMLEKGLWATGGKTPAATIYSAILREINVKGDQSRFRKVERGRFELTR